MSHIALFLPSLCGGGAERIMVTLANEFASKGHRVDLVLASKEGPYLSEVSQHVHIIDLKRKRVLTSLIPLARYLRQARPDAILSAMNHANIIAIWAKKISRSKARLVVSEHNAPSKSLFGGRMKAVMRFLIKAFYRRADVTVAVSRGIEKELLKLFSLSPERTTTIYNPLDIEKIRGLMNAPIHHEWVENKTNAIILAAGRLTKQKDYKMLLQAFSILRKTKTARLIILGQGEELESLRSLSKDLNISSDVLFAGFQENPYAWMRRCDVYAMSSAWEGLPGTLLEALACGAKVVSTNCPTGPDEILENGKWGRLVPVGDATAMAEAIDESLDAPPPPSADLSLTRFRKDVIVNAYLHTLTSP